MPPTNSIAPSHPALQAPSMSVERLAAMCFESAHDDTLDPQFKAMNGRLWILIGHLRVALARQAALGAQIRQLPAGNDLATRVGELDAQLAGFVKLFGPDIAQRLAPKPAAATEQQPTEPAPAPSPAPTAPPAADDPEAALVQTAMAAKAEDMAGAKIVQVSKAKGKK